MRLNPSIYGLLVLLFFLGTIGIAQSAGLWAVSGKVSVSGERVTATGANVDEIKGWMKLDDVANAYNVPVEDILAAFGLPADTPPTKQLKELESDKFSMTTLRTWLKTRPEQK